MKHPLCRALGPLLVALAIAGCATQTTNPPAAPTAQNGPPKSMLWVGNSF